MALVSNNSKDPDDDALPARLRGDLLRAAGSTPHVPHGIDLAILLNAKAGYARRTRWRPVVRWAGFAAAMAAAVIVVVTIAHVPRRSLTNLAQIGDVNHDGRVDILDAFIVAKHLANGDKTDPGWDVNHDGVVDQKDVDWIAATAVSVSGSAAGGGPQ